MSTRSIQDNTFVASFALPNNATSTQHTAFDVGANLGPTAEGIQLEVSSPALASLADTKSVTYVVQDSADNSSFANVAALGTRAVTGAGGAGTAAATYRWPLPESVRRYIRVQAVGEAAMGNMAASNATVALQF